MHLRRLLAPLAAALLALHSGNALAQPAPIRIGLLASITGAPANGLAARLGASMAVQEINLAGGLDGHRIELVIADDQANATQAAAETRRLVYQEKIVFLLGGSTSITTIPGIPVLNEAHIASVSAAGASTLTPQFAPYHFSLLPTAAQQAGVMARYAGEVLKVKSAAVLNDETGFGVEGGNGLKQELAQRHVPLGAAETFAFQATDLTPQLLRLRRANPEVVLLFTGSGDAIGYLRKGLDEIGWSPRIVGNVAVTALYKLVIAKAGPDAMRGMEGVTSKYNAWCPGDALDTGVVAQFRRRLDATAPGTKADPLSAIYMYDGVQIFRAAWHGTGGNTDGAAMAKWIEQHYAEMQGLVGGVTEISPDNHFAQGPRSMAIVADIDQPRADGMMRRVDCGL